MILRKYYPTIVLSDIHLGSEHSRTEEVTRFLKHVDCDRLILNGDIIDGWQLKKSGKRWKQKHTDFFKVLASPDRHGQGGDRPYRPPRGHV